MGVNVSVENNVDETRIKGCVLTLTKERYLFRLNPSANFLNGFNSPRIECWDFDVLPGETFSRRSKNLLPGPDPPLAAILTLVDCTSAVLDH